MREGKTSALRESSDHMRTKYIWLEKIPAKVSGDFNLDSGGKQLTAKLNTGVKKIYH